MKNLFKILFIALIISPVFVLAARTDGLWDFNGLYYSPNGTANGADLFLKGTNHYINFSTLTGTNGYGLRDNSGTVEFKNSGGSWTGIGTGGGGGVSSVATNNGLTGGTITTTGTLGLDITGLSTNGLITWNGSKLVATGTPQLTVGNILATSTTVGIQEAWGGSRNLLYMPFQDGSQYAIGIQVDGAPRRLQLFAKAADGNSGIDFMTGSTPSTQMSVMDNGYVGIGSTSPATKLVVADSSTNAFINVVASGVGIGNIAGIQFTDAQGVGGAYSSYIASDSRDTDGFFGNNNINGIVYKSGRPGLGGHSFLNSGNTLQMAITEAGRVGIGTSSPSATLSVNAPAQSQAYFAIGSSSSQVFSVSPSASGILSVATSSTLRVLNLGPDPSTTNGSTTIRFQKLQFEGLNSAGVMSCTYVVGTAWVVQAGACN